MRAIRWGVLGTGSISRDFVQGLLHAPGSEVVAVASRARERAEGFARELGMGRGVDLKGLLESDAEVVYVASPPQAHKEHAIACLEAGKAVLLEKPFATDAEEAKAIAAAARRSQRFCMEAMWMRFVPAMREVVTDLRHGRHGQVLSMEASLGFAQADPAGARDGALLDLGVYPLSFAHAVLGTPHEVRAVGDAAEVSILLQFDKGHAAVRCSLRNVLRNDAVVWAEKARVSLEAPLYRPESYTVQPVVPLAAPAAGADAGAASSPMGLLRQVTRRPELRRWVQRAKALTDPTVTRPALGNGYAHQAIEVNDCLRNGAKESALMPLDQSVAVMQTVDAVRRALS